jgi:hypothetical protein
VKGSIGRTRLRRGIGCHPDEHPGPEIGDPNHKEQEKWGEDGSFDRRSATCTKEKISHLATSLR